MKSKNKDFGRETSLSDDWGDKVETNGKFYLSDILTEEKHYRPMLLDNHITVLNKGVCGNGGTTSIIDFIQRSKRGCLFLVPNVSIVKSKAEKYKDNNDICCVYGGVTDINYSAKIVIATYDQFKRLLSNLEQAGGDLFNNEFWAGRAIFVDEYHKLVDDQYREVMAEITELIIKTKEPITLISATPHNEFINSLKGVLSDRKVFIKWDLDYSENKLVWSLTPYELGQSCLKGYIKGIIDSGKKYCVFVNNISVVSEVVFNHEKGDECEILCSEENKDTAGDFYSDVYNKEKRVHFMTSAFFTGHDIHCSDIYRVVIIGGRSGEAMSISLRDIKQILGRFRHYCCDNPDTKTMNNILLIYLKERINITSHDNVKTGLKDTTKTLAGLGDRWVENDVCIRPKLYNIYYSDTLERLGYWMRDKNIIKKLKDEGYIVYAKSDGRAIEAYDIPDYNAETEIAYKHAYTKIKNGEDITRKEYRFAPEIKLYFKLEGKSGKMPTRDELLKIVKIGKKITKKEEIKRFSLADIQPDDRYEVFDFKDGFQYKASYLLGCIKYIKKHYPSLLIRCNEIYGEDSELQYPLLPFYMKEVFNCIIVREKGSRGNKFMGSQDVWRVMRCNNKYDFFAENCSPSGYFSTIDNHPEGMQLSANIKLSRMIRYDETQKSNIGDTILFKDITCYISNTVRPLEGKYKYTYDWVTKDKKNRLKEMKGTENWNYIKEKWQLMISELYCDTDKEYRHRKSDCNTIDSLIIDIDNSITFSKFQEMFGNWAWLAYPTISNTEVDWNKFRVIVPLAHPVKLEGENNLKILKALRSMFCVFEDACHNMGSYINTYDFAQRYINKGDVYSVNQKDVDAIQRIYDIKDSCIKKKFNNTEIDTNITDNAIKRAIADIQGAKEGSRNQTISAHLYNLIKGLNVSDEQLDYIRQQITDDDKIKEYDRLVRYLRHRIL